MRKRLQAAGLGLIMLLAVPSSGFARAVPYSMYCYREGCISNLEQDLFTRSLTIWCSGLGMHARAGMGQWSDFLGVFCVGD